MRTVTPPREWRDPLTGSSICAGKGPRLVGGTFLCLRRAGLTLGEDDPCPSNRVAVSVNSAAARSTSDRSPGRGQENLLAAPAKALLAKVRPRNAAGRARRRVAAELISDLERIYRRTKEADNELKELVAATGTTLMDLHGIVPSGAARLLVEVGDVTRFPNRAHFASWNRSAYRRLLQRPG